jgi:hypothetical protein
MDARTAIGGHTIRGVIRAALPMAAALAAFMIVVTTPVVGGQMATADRTSGPDWWPTKGTPPRQDYVGTDACARCHPAQSKTQPMTSMARTASRAHNSDVLRGLNRLAFSHGGYSYDVATTAEQTLYSVSDGARSASVPLSWAFGAGTVGQSFLFERDGAFNEARVSYYHSVRALDFTPARAVDAPKDVSEALSRQVGATEARRCFACHTTASTTDGQFAPASATPGITCEACHGPGRRHADAMGGRRAAEGQPAILNPARLEPADSVDFCGACHATFWDVKLAGEKGLAALRSQPYRLLSSRCWSGGDARITCAACHNPHLPIVREAAAYDSRCLSCHTDAGAAPSRERAAPACPVGRANCVRCHMPKYEVREMHHEFTDHLIRIARAKLP